MDICRENRTDRHPLTIMEVCLPNTMTKRWHHTWNKCSALCYLTVLSMYMIFYVWKLYREQLHICLCVLINNKGELFLDDVASPEFTQVKPIVTQFSKFQRPPFSSSCDIKYLWARGKGLRILQLDIIRPTVVKYRTLEQFYHSISVAWWKQPYSSVKLISGQHSLFIGQQK